MREGECAFGREKVENLCPRKECKFRVSENRVLRRMSGYERQ
jgi:hypothetical protein